MLVGGLVVEEGQKQELTRERKPADCSCKFCRGRWQQADDGAGGVTSEASTTESQCQGSVSVAGNHRVEKPKSADSGRTLGSQLPKRFSPVGPIVV